MQSTLSSGCDGFIAVHLGAGYHSEVNNAKYEVLCRMACRLAMKLLRAGHKSTDVVAKAVAILEDSPLTNAGIGSNLTECGEIECDASIMDGESLNHGAVGALPGIKNPIEVAKSLLNQQNKGLLSLGRIPPCFLVAEGAKQWALNHGFISTSQEELKSETANESFKRYKRKLLEYEQKNCKLKTDIMDKDMENEKLDTVGAVCIDKVGNVASAVSSGGIAMKHSGRIGQAAVYGCGCWAQNSTTSSKPAIAVATSGSGEYLIKTFFARECANYIHDSEDTITAVQNVIDDKFLNSPMVTESIHKLIGIIALKHSPEKEYCELVWAHTTRSMCISYSSSILRQPKVVISRLKDTTKQGKEIVIQAIGIKMKLTAPNSKS